MTNKYGGETPLTFVLGTVSNGSYPCKQHVGIKIYEKSASKLNAEIWATQYKL